jgi:hypothetical protein
MNAEPNFVRHRGKNLQLPLLGLRRVWHSGNPKNSSCNGFRATRAQRAAAAFIRVQERFFLADQVFAAD